MKKWWIGCSGFYYKTWKDRFYPPKLPQRKWFEYYCEFFNTVELNVTFYRFPKIEMLKGWYARSPEDFRFTAKAPRLITHFKRFHDARREAKDFYKLLRDGLQAKLGTVLFQLHPGIHYSSDNLERILETLDPSFRNILEFRHESWWNNDVIDELKRNNVSFCGISYPGLPDQVMKSGEVVYYRFHGVPKLYLSSYADNELSHVASSISKFRNVTDVYAYFNNDIEVAAIFNARKLQEFAGMKPAALSTSSETNPR
jgi:uncharacterized protein YecE (DUF72 family)